MAVPVTMPTCKGEISEGLIPYKEIQGEINGW